MPRGACLAGVPSEVRTVFGAPARAPAAAFLTYPCYLALATLFKSPALLALQFLPGHYVRSGLEMDRQCTEMRYNLV